MANRILAPLQQVLTSAGTLGSGLKLFVYEAGTTTKIDTFSTPSDADAGVSANSNPVVLDSRGEPSSGGMWLPDSVLQYKLVLAPSGDTDPPASPIRTQDDIATIRSRDYVSVRDYGAVGDGSTNDSSAFNAALAASNSVYVPEGTYVIQEVDVAGKRVWGPGTIEKTSAGTYGFQALGDGTVIEGLTFVPQSVSGQPNSDIKLGDGAKNVRIINNTFIGDIYSAIAAAVDSEVEGTPYSVPVSGVVISGNIFKAQDKEGKDWYIRPIYLHSVCNITIADNIIRDCGYDAIRLRENDGYCVISGNQFIDVGDAEWPDEQTRDAVDSFWAGTDLIITNNVVRSPAYIGFDIKGVNSTGDKRTQRVIVSCNIIDSPRYEGIVISGQADNDGFVDSYVITQNIIRRHNQNNLGVGTSGIKADRLSKYLTISQNIVEFGKGRGIYIAEDPDESLNSMLTIVENKCINNTETGLLIDNASPYVCAFNMCVNDASMENSNQQTIGIQISAGTGGVHQNTKQSIFAFNICKNNTTSQIHLNSSGSRMDPFLTFFGNVEVGASAYQYARFGNARALLFGNGTAPDSTDGAFQTGDIVFDSTPVAGAGVGHVCTSGGTPGTWVKFGTLNLDGSATYDPPSLAAGATVSTTVAVTGAAAGDFAEASHSDVSTTNADKVMLSAKVTAVDTVTVVLWNTHTSSVNLASGALRVRVRKA